MDTPHLPSYEDEIGGTISFTLYCEYIEDGHYDQCLNSEVLLPIQGTRQTSKVVGSKMNADGIELSRDHSKTILDTREYIVHSMMAMRQSILIMS